MMTQLPPQLPFYEGEIDTVDHQKRMNNCWNFDWTGYSYEREMGWLIMLSVKSHLLPLSLSQMCHFSNKSQMSVHLVHRYIEWRDEASDRQPPQGHQRWLHRCPPCVCVVHVSIVDHKMRRVVANVHVYVCVYMCMCLYERRLHLISFINFPIYMKYHKRVGLR